MVRCICVISCGSDWWPFWLRPNWEGEQDTLKLSDFGVVDEEEQLAQLEARRRRFGGVPLVLKEQPHLSALLALLPVAMLHRFCKFPDWQVFISNYLAAIPTAWLVAKSAKDISAPSFGVVGGLLMTFFNNIVTLLLLLSTFEQKKVTALHNILLGSIMSNLLFVTGCSFIFAGERLDYHVLRAGSCTHSSLMLLAVISILLPVLYQAAMPGGEGHAAAINILTKWYAILLLSVYLQYLVFQLRTHRFLFFAKDLEPVHGMSASAELKPWAAAVILGGFMACAYFLTQSLILALPGFAQGFQVTERFAAAVLLPLISNIAELITTTRGERRHYMDRVLDVAAGSACQTALLVMPVVVLLGRAHGLDMALQATPMQAVLLAVSVILTTASLEGHPTWVEGAALVAVWLLTATCTFFDADL